MLRQQKKPHHVAEENRTSGRGARGSAGDEGAESKITGILFTHPFREVLKTVAHKPEVLYVNQHLRSHFNCVGPPASEEISEE